MGIALVSRKQLCSEDINDVLSSNPLIHYDWDAWSEMMKENDAPWCVQDRSPLKSMVYYGRMQFRFQQETPKFALLKDFAAQAEQWAKETAKKCTREFDMIITYPAKKDEVTYQDVPKIVRKGLLKKETIYEKKELHSFRLTTEQLKFDGWLLEHFQRDCIEGTAKSIISWDYCLGKDGNLYVITSTYGTNGDPNDIEKYFVEEIEYEIDDMIPFNMLLMQNKNQNVFINVSHGLVFALDAVPIGPRESSWASSDGLYTFNFPLQINELDDCPFAPLMGLRARLEKLLT